MGLKSECLKTKERECNKLLMNKFKDSQLQVQSAEAEVEFKPVKPLELPPMSCFLYSGALLNYLLYKTTFNLLFTLFIPFVCVFFRLR